MTICSDGKIFLHSVGKRRKFKAVFYKKSLFLKLLLHTVMKQTVTLVILTAFIVALSLESHGCATGERTSGTPLTKSRNQALSLAALTPKPTQLPRIQDDFAELDDTVATTPMAGVSDRFIMTTLESARQQYLKALSHINKSDTVRAARSFEQAIEILNRISDLPKIEENADFTDLMQSIIDDYENYIQSIDNLNEQSPFFVLREKFFQEAEKNTPVYNELSFARVKETKPEISHLKLPESSTEMTKILGMKGIPLQIPMEDNESTQRTIEMFTSVRARSYFQKWLQRAGRWFPMMRKIAREEGAPEEIIYLSMIESGLSPVAVSRAQAVGLWQFIKSTGNLYGLEAGYWVDERRDPEKATRAAMRHLKDLYNEFGDWYLAMAAYNCGVGGTRRAISRSGGGSHLNYWDIWKKLPRETRGYVPLYVAAAKITMSPEAYGFVNLPLEVPYDYDTVAIHESIELRVLARCAGISTTELEYLNPELIRSATPPNIDVYPLKIPKGKKEDFLANFEKLNSEDKHTWVLHEVANHETLQSIAKKYKVSAQIIAVANDLTGKKKRLSVGSMIRIPTDGKYSDEDDNTQEVAHVPSGNNRQREREKDPTPTSSPIPAHTKKVVHEVHSGETLYSIANRYGVRLADLRNWNNIPYNSDNVSLGAQLTLHVDKNYQEDDNAETTASPKSAKTTIVAHVVKRGETLAKIADDYNVPMNDIRTQSGMKKKDKIHVGQTLKIPVAATSAVAKKSEQADESRPTTTKQPTTAPGSGKLTAYTVKKGESLTDIANRFAVSAKDILRWNPGTKGDRLAVGSELKIYPNSTNKGGGEEESGGKFYTVKQGDTLFSIAKKYGLSVTTMLKINKGLVEHKLALGQKLRVSE